MTLAELYKETIEDYSLWDYYESENTHFSFELLNCYQTCKNFIQEYMRHGGKANLGIGQDFDDLIPTRIKHIVSCFFLGLGIYRKVQFFQQKINRSITPRKSDTKEQHFSYLWFLTVLFHDIGYAVEERGIKTFDKEKYKEYLDLIKNLGRRPKNIPKVYTKQILRNYLRCRMCSRSRFDHGIIGGIKLYKCLTEFKHQIVENQNLASSQYTDRKNLYWGPELDTDFNFISWVVACHNIWFTNDKDTLAHYYHCCKLDKLIIQEDGYQISANQHPFLFLFLLADSIEPIKRLEEIECFDWKRLKVTDWFNRIDICFNNDSITLDLSRLPEFGIDKLSSSISGLDSWLTHVREDNGKNMYKINIIN